MRQRILGDVVLRPDLIAPVLAGDAALVRARLRRWPRAKVDQRARGLKLQSRSPTMSLIADGFEPLHIACWLGHDEIAGLLLEAGVDPDRRTPRGWSPLTLAAHEGRDAVVDLLIAHGADVHGHGSPMNKPLHEAATFGHEGVVAALLRAGADPNAYPPGRRPPLEGAVYGGSAVVARLLVDAGADALHVDHMGFTPRMHAAWLHRDDLVRILGRPGIAASLSDAAAAGDIDTVRAMLAETVEEGGAFREGGGAAALGWAARVGSRDVVALLLGAGADPTVRGLGGAADEIAAREGHLEVLDLLLGTGRPLERVLVAALEGWQLDAARYLIDRGAPPGADTLVAAAQTGDPAFLAAVLDAGAPVDARNAAGFTALHVGAAMGSDDVVRALLQRGADPTALNREGRTPRDVAIEEGWTEISNVLATAERR